MNLKQRKPMRLAEHHYVWGWYFVTICSFQKAVIFGNVKNGRMCLSQYGSVVHRKWNDISKRHKYAEAYDFIVMPDHVHGIIQLRDYEGARRGVPVRKFGSLQPGTLSIVVNQFKADVTKEIRKQEGPYNVWQRSFHEKCILNSEMHKNIRKYIISNPKNWKQKFHSEKI